MRLCRCAGRCKFANCAHARRQFFAWRCPYLVLLLSQVEISSCSLSFMIPPFPEGNLPFIISRISTYSNCTFIAALLAISRVKMSHGACCLPYVVTTLLANSADDELMIFFFFFIQKIVFDISCKLAPFIWQCLISPRKQVSTFHANCLHSSQFAWNVKNCFLGKIRFFFSKCRLLKILPRMLRIKQTGGTQVA